VGAGLLMENDLFITQKKKKHGKCLRERYLKKKEKINKRKLKRKIYKKQKKNIYMSTK